MTSPRKRTLKRINALASRSDQAVSVIALPKKYASDTYNMGMNHHYAPPRLSDLELQRAAIKAKEKKSPNIVAVVQGSLSPEYARRLSPAIKRFTPTIASPLTLADDEISILDLEDLHLTDGEISESEQSETTLSVPSSPIIIPSAAPFVKSPETPPKKDPLDLLHQRHLEAEVNRLKRPSLRRPRSNLASTDNFVPMSRQEDNSAEVRRSPVKRKTNRSKFAADRDIPSRSLNQEFTKNPTPHNDHNKMEENKATKISEEKLKQNKFYNNLLYATLFGGNTRSVLNRSVLTSPVATVPAAATLLKKEVKTNTQNTIGRNIDKDPYKILDAPELADDYYLNLIDWSPQGLFAVSLGAGVYTWLESTKKNEKIQDSTEEKMTTSLQWKDNSRLYCGNNIGEMIVIDVETKKSLHTVRSHEQRVTTLAHMSNSLLTSSQDGKISLWDLRQPDRHIKSLKKHTLEVCSLSVEKISESYFSSGGNDNLLYIWDLRFLDETKPTAEFKFNACVKAKFHPTRSGILVAGAGTDDRTINLINLFKPAGEQIVFSQKLASQVANLTWVLDGDGLVHTSGFSENSLHLWSVNKNTLTEKKKLKEHAKRPIHLAAHPDGNIVVTGADEKLSFWKIGPKKNQKTTNKLDHNRIRFR